MTETTRPVSSPEQCVGKCDRKSTPGERSPDRANYMPEERKASEKPYGDLKRMYGKKNKNSPKGPESRGSGLFFKHLVR